MIIVVPPIQLLTLQGAFTNSERCTAAASGFPTRTIIIIGSTTTEPGGPLYTLTTQGVFGCLATATPTQTATQTPTPTQTKTPVVTNTPTPTTNTNTNCNSKSTTL